MDNVAVKKGLLLGAGFSYDFGMPIATELTEVFLGLFTKESANHFVGLLAHNSPYGEDHPINMEALKRGMELLLTYKSAGGRNYEELLSNIQSAAKDYNSPQTDRDTYHYLFGVFYSLIYTILCNYQVEAHQTLYQKNIKWLENFGALLSNEETWIFSLNHDLFVECLAIDLGVPITFGDKYSISFPLSNLNLDDLIDLTYSHRDDLTKNESEFFQGTYGINLLKLHGGLSELHYQDGNKICNQNLRHKTSDALLSDFSRVLSMGYFYNGEKVPSGRDRVISNLNGELDIICQSMLTGGSKYSLTTNEKPGEEKLQVFSKKLSSLDELTIIGYGFGDKHVNNRLLNAMVLSKHLKLVIVDPIHRPIPEFLEQFNYENRIKTAQCGAAHWMEYVSTKKWNMVQVDELKANASIRETIKRTVVL
ncbi:hypothetical protein [Pseudomonas sp. PDM04]|uniref:hypothetical protein n=1 Tax=Pseudomonas sp. PDM04 TaxID=2769296 RepID=UPI00177C95E8|nr:hypothetical protein [Pseudomonas sp. PDM04]MBD9439411.1 hypothetical protein [Pseudomonas sp. PDM04]